MPAKRKKGGRKKEGCLTRLFVAAVLLSCALALGALFYTAMIYQLPVDRIEEEAQEGPAQTGLSLRLTQGELASERTESARHGGRDCAALVREYRLPDGIAAKAITATPAAYVERLSEEGWEPQPVTGFLLAGLDAVYETRGEEAILLARDGETIYAVEGPLSEEEIYSLGAGSKVE